MADVSIFDFDAHRLYAALDAKRTTLGLSWRGVADEIWQLSAELNRQRTDHPISPSTLVNIEKRGATSCQHALFMLRWLDASPEDFLTGVPVSSKPTPLPIVGPDRRLRWDLKTLYAALDERRREREMTWPELAKVVRCTPSQLTGLRKARFTTGINVAMHVVQWLERPAADFVYASRW